MDVHVQQSLINNHNFKGKNAATACGYKYMPGV